MSFSLRITTFLLFCALFFTSSVTAQNCTPSTLVTILGDNPSYNQYLKLFASNTEEYTQEQIKQILAEIERCNNAALAEQNDIVRKQKSLISKSQSLQECTDIEALQNDINKLQESKKGLLEGMKRSIEKVKFSGIYGIILNNINTRTDFNIHTTQCNDAITLAAVENLVGTQITRTTTLDNFNQIRDVITSYKAGAMQVTEEIFKSPQTNTRCFFYIVEFSISPKEPKNNNGQIAFEQNNNATVLDLFNTLDWKKQFTNKGAEAAKLNDKQAIITNRLSIIQSENKSAEEELQVIAQNTAQEMTNIDTQIATKQQEIDRKIKKLRTTATEFKIQIDEKQPFQALKRILTEMNTRILALGKDWQAAKNKEIKNTNGVAELHGKPNESLAQNTLALCTQLKTTYEPVRYNFETIDVENFKTTNFKRTNTRVFSHRLTQSWSYPVPNGATFMLYVLGRFEVVEGGSGLIPPSPDDIEMVFIKGGAFFMGKYGRSFSPTMKASEGHYVEVADFSIGKYEVTQKFWKSIMENNPSEFNDCDNCPVEQVNWDDIQDFLQKLNNKTGKNYRLPTEEEWEKAARGGPNDYLYAGSENLIEVGWVDVISHNKTHEVGKLKSNNYGLYDMSGNVAEWCDSWFRDKYSRIVRGGSYISGFAYWDLVDCFVIEPSYSSPDTKISSLGFRLALSVQ